MGCIVLFLEDEPYVRNGRVGNHSLEVCLTKTDDGSVDKTGHSKENKKRDERQRRLREYRDCDSQESVSAHLEHDSGQEHRTCSWGLYVSIWKPGMDGNACILVAKPIRSSSQTRCRRDLRLQSNRLL